MILRDELNLKPAPMAHRFAASGFTFSSSRNDSYPVGNNDRPNQLWVSDFTYVSTGRAGSMSHL